MLQSHAHRSRIWIGLWLFSNLGRLSPFVGGEVISQTAIADRVERITFASEAFSASKTACVVLPQGYTAERADWPVLYLLHGRGRNDRSLIDDADSRAVLLSAPFVTVLPNGEDGWYLDSPVTAKDRYGKLLEETIAAAETKYRLSRRPQRRAIAGWSMGGYGAVRFAESHPGQFSLVASIIGLLDFPRHGLPAGQTHSIPARTFGEAEQVWQRLNPLNSAEQLQGSAVLLIVADQAFDRTMNEHFHQRLNKLKIEHQWKVLQGGHTFDVVKQAIPLVIERAGAEFAGARDP